MKNLMHIEKDVSQDMDFNDVFGGPPMRFSMQEIGTRLSSESDEEKALSPWSGRKEKPVFGEDVRSRRRHHQGDEFFNDIFKGVESYPSPRRSDRDRESSFGSNPGSRNMSLLPPMLDHFPTSLPAHFSLPAKVNKGMELPTFGSSSPSSRFSSRRHDDETRVDESCFIVTDDSSSHNKDKINDTSTNNVDNMFSQFHFSIYKWAGRGVPMLNDFKSDDNYSKNIKQSDSRKQQSVPAEPMRTRHVDKKETKEQVVLHVKKKTELLNSQVKKPIHSFLSEAAHQEIKDKKLKTSPRVDESRKRVDEGRNGQVSEKKNVNVKEFVQIFKQEGESGDVVAAKDHNKLGHVSFKVVEDLYNHQPQPSQPPTTTLPSETDSKISEENADDFLDDNFMVEEIFDAQENVEASESCDDTKAIDAKIRQWSVGKKGNIRSLLSTLQYVLWEESGWKAVALVDLIEANSVKRAYQKALLRLHPDKLQQKGASFHHKYTAEKVFDILQEAWDHFNTSSLIV